MFNNSLTYTPTELGFGTSGLRALVTDMTDLECYINARGFLSFLQQIGCNNTAIYIGGDLRGSTPRIMGAMQQAIQDAGFTPVNCGLIPTPALAYHAQANNAACIMVTGSHIPADRNGVKFYRHDGEVMKEDEIDIKAAVAEIRETLYSQTVEDSLFKPDGSFKSSVTLQSVQDDIIDEYLNRFLSVYTDKPLAGKEVVVYQHSAVGRDMLVTLMEQLGATVKTEGRSDTFISIDTENVTPDDAAYFKQIAAQHPGVFAIVSTDGDSDRPFVIDENGLFHRGDELGAVVADVLQADFCAYPISTNDAVDAHLSNKNVPFEHTKIGSTHVITAMQRAVSDGLQHVVGWEVNGGFLTMSDIDVNGNTLVHLPTRDAFLPITIALVSAAQQKRSVSALFTDIPPRFTQAGLIDDFPVTISKQIVSRYSEDNELLREELAQYFAAHHGFGDIVQVDTLDGIRIYFSNNDIAHMRPSGNAPQLRIYSVADTQERADTIVKIALEEPNGIFRSIQQGLSEQE